MFLIAYKILFRYEVLGSENVPEQGGAIIAANHLSYLDPPLVGIAVKRRATFMARSSLFKIPLVGTFVGSFSIPVHRGDPRPSTIKEAVKRLKRGELIAMFPEGGRNPKGKISGGKRGVAIIASMSGAVVIPALIEGTDKALPVGAKFIRPSKVRITFGKPLDVKPYETNRELQRRMTEDIMNAIKGIKKGGRFQSGR